MAKKVVNKKAVEKIAVKKITIANEIVKRFDAIESKEKKTALELSADFRKISVDMYNAVHVNKVFKSGRELSRTMKRANSDVARYINAGKFLSIVTDKELAEKGYNAFNVKTLVRKISKEIKSATNVDAVKKADKKVTKKISKEKSAITIDQAVSTLSTFIINSPDIKKVEAVKELLKDLINFKNKKQMAMEKLVAGKKVTVVTK
jgi:uncharacterized protein YigE (DUF2233 family)